MNEPVWHTACSTEEIEEGMRLVQIGKHRIVVTKIDDRLFAFDNFCSHVGGPMHRGELFSTVVTCPLHGWRFDLENNGEEIHGFRPLAMFPIREENGNLQVLL